MNLEELYSRTSLTTINLGESYSRTSLTTINFSGVVLSYLAIDEQNVRGRHADKSPSGLGSALYFLILFVFILTRA